MAMISKEERDKATDEERAIRRRGIVTAARQAPITHANRVIRLEVNFLR
jgi:hypothetical protein